MKKVLAGLFLIASLSVLAINKGKYNLNIIKNINKKGKEVKIWRKNQKLQQCYLYY